MDKPNEMFIETRRMGAILRVTAIDAATGTEVVFQAPVSTPKEVLHRLAARKLCYVMKKGSGVGVQDSGERGI